MLASNSMLSPRRSVVVLLTQLRSPHLNETFKDNAAEAASIMRACFALPIEDHVLIQAEALDCFTVSEDERERFLKILQLTLHNRHGPPLLIPTGQVTQSLLSSCKILLQKQRSSYSATLTDSESPPPSYSLISLSTERDFSSQITSSTSLSLYVKR